MYSDTGTTDRAGSADTTTCLVETPAPGPSVGTLSPGLGTLSPGPPVGTPSPGPAVGTLSPGPPEGGLLCCSSGTLSPCPSLLPTWLSEDAVALEESLAPSSLSWLSPVPVSFSDSEESALWLSPQLAPPSAEDPVLPTMLDESSPSLPSIVKASWATEDARRCRNTSKPNG